MSGILTDFINDSCGHEEIKCLFIPRKKFLDICSRYPATALKFAEIAQNRINFEREVRNSTVLIKVVSKFG